MEQIPISGKSNFKTLVLQKDPGNDDWAGDSEDDNDKNDQEPYKCHDFYKWCILLLLLNNILYA